MSGLGRILHNPPMRATQRRRRRRCCRCCRGGSFRRTQSGRRAMNIATGDVLPAADADAGAAPRGSSNIRHLSRMELPGGGQIVIQGTHRLRRPSDRAGGHDDPRHLRSAQAEGAVADHVPASVVAYAQGAGRRRHHGGQFRARAGQGQHSRISRRRLPHLRRQGQDQSEADHLPQDPRQGRASLRSRRELRLHLDRDGGLCRQHPGDLRHPQSVEADRGRALVHGEPARRQRRHAASEGHRASPASRHAQRQPDVRRLLDVGRRASST